MGVDVGVRVLRLAVLRQHARDDLEHRGHDLEQLVVGHELLGELALGGVPRVSDAQHSMAVARNNLQRTTDAADHNTPASEGSGDRTAVDTNTTTNANTDTGSRRIPTSKAILTHDVPQRQAIAT